MAATTEQATGAKRPPCNKAGAASRNTHRAARNSAGDSRRTSNGTRGDHDGSTRSLSGDFYRGANSTANRRGGDDRTDRAAVDCDAVALATGAGGAALSHDARLGVAGDDGQSWGRYEGGQQE